jgi:hypothetical protein
MEEYNEGKNNLLSSSLAHWQYQLEQGRLTEREA